MAWIALVRHGITEWNELGLIQGRTDIPLNATGVAQLQQTRLCDEFLRARWFTSPLQRAVQTAAILNPRAGAEIHPDLIETNWGQFEGTHRTDLPRRIRARALEPDCGLDFIPPAGESARMVRRRLLRWFAKVAATHTDTAMVAVTHKGVIRSVLSAACGWDMTTDFNPEPNWSLPHIFEFGPGETLRLVRLDCPWDEPPRYGALSPPV